jgi:glucose-1-phosphate adenylyltransferase
MLGNKEKLIAYRFKGYWKDVGTLESLWDANMDMLSPASGLDLIDSSWPIYARSVNAPSTFVDASATVTHSAVNRGCEIYGAIENAVLSPNVTVGAGAKVSYSVLLPGAKVEEGAVVEYAILGENCTIGKNARVGARPEESDPAAWGLTVLAPGCNVAEGSVVAANKMLGQNGEEVSR